MLLRNILLKNIRDRRVGLFWWSFSFFLLNFYMCSFLPVAIKSAADLKGYLENLPEAFKAAFGITTAAGIFTPTGFFNTELFSLIIPLMFLIYAVVFGAGAIAGEEETGTLDLLLANPIPRWRVALEKFLAMVLGLGIITLVSWLGFVIGVYVYDINISLAKLAAANVSSALLGLSFGAVAFGIGCATGRKSLAAGVAIGLTAASYILNVMSKVVDSLEPYEKLSLFFYSTDADPLSHGLRFADIGVFLAVIAVFLIGGLVLFNRRDLSV
jgi:ABC-2 type transport system permease protein